MIFIKFDQDGDIVDKIKFVSNTEKVELNYSQTRKHVETVIKEKYLEIEKRVQDFVEQGSGWTLSEVCFIDISFTTLKGLRGGCSFHYKEKRGLLNIKSEDDFCLLYCILANFYGDTIHQSQKNQSFSYTKYMDVLKKDGVRFPIHPDEIGLLEEQNKHLNFGVNVFIEENNEIYLHRQCEGENEEGQKNVINVLLVEGRDLNGERKYHYILISCIEKFLKKKYINSKGEPSFANTVTCGKCFASFRSDVKKSLHENICGKTDEKKINLTFLPKNTKISFQKPWNGFPHLLSGFVDFESILIKLNPEIVKKCEKCRMSGEDCSHSFTEKIHHHQAMNYCFILVDRYLNVVFQKNYTGVDAVENFLKTLIELQDSIMEFCRKNEEMNFTKEDKKKFDEAFFCYICGNKFLHETDKRRDHDHSNSRFIGAAHNTCNLNRKEKSIVKIFAHNFSGYDSHLIIEKLNVAGVEKVEAIPKSGEKFMAVSINNFYTLCDSMSFLSGSLDSLAKTLPKNHPYHILRSSKKMMTRINSEEEFKIFFEKWKYRE